MNINKDNYEEYFLLYADNELSEQERYAVENFVEQFPELEEELLVIKLSVSKPDDDYVLDDKTFLFKEEDKFIGDANYEEVFVLYNDDELNEDERKRTEGFLLNNPAFKKDLELLQKTKLVADNTIVFPGKKSLYKKEDGGKIIALKWWRVAAAAILLGAGLWFGVAQLQNNNRGIQGTAKNNPAKETKKIIPAPVDKKAIEPVNIVAANKEIKTPKQKLIVKRSASKPSLKKNELPADPPVVKNETRPNVLPDRDVVNNNVIKEETKIETQNVISLYQKNIDNDNADNKPSKENDVAMVTNDTEPKVVKTSFAADENENNNYAFYNISQEKFNKSKVGGFLRKVKRIIERKISPFNNSKDKTEIAVN